ncbi:hypothetical protein EVAR_83607_1 [Eumeta japonica]|uniref:Histone-lysine N-methyltransferase SETMAR n=1 Tax=Eumeta variegata TaxID=151549 RepID=A0A4C1UPT5_EUMVA|nr:hypothetical protein EVAR_83607_1 [Eumeta japonica]
MQDRHVTDREIKTSLGINRQKIKSTDHPPYNPDLALNDFYLFSSLKNKLRSQSFSSRKEAIDAFKMHVLGIPQSERKKCYKNWLYEGRLISPRPKESAPSYTMVKKWARLFQQGRESCEDDPRPGRPVTVVTEENTSKDFLELVGDNIDEICDRIVTVDETWVRQYDPESKQESIQWMKKGERPPKKFKGTTMNGQYYTNLLAQAREAVVQKGRGKLSRGVLFLQDNTSVHTARVSSGPLSISGRAGSRTLFARTSADNAERPDER